MKRFFTVNDVGLSAFSDKFGTRNIGALPFELPQSKFPAKATATILETSQHYCWFVKLL
jgi:hypothetical protein